VAGGRADMSPAGDGAVDGLTLPPLAPRALLAGEEEVARHLEEVREAGKVAGDVPVACVDIAVRFVRGLIPRGNGEMASGCA